MHLVEPKTVPSLNLEANHAIWQLPFRSFFITGILFSSVSIMVWLLILTGKLTLVHQVLPRVIWHAHEMIFGFAMLMAVGFVLTAAKTRKYVSCIKGIPAGLLLAIWGVIRIALFINSQLSVKLAIALTLVWWLAIVLIYSHIVLSTKNKRDYIFISIFCVLASFDLATLSFSTIGETSLALHFTRAAVLMFSILISIIYGRVITLFIIQNSNTKPYKHILWVEKLLLPTAVTGISVFIIGYFIELPITPAMLMTTAGCLHLLRISKGLSLKALMLPLLWVLNISYAFMGLGLITLGLSYGIDSITFSTASHLITVGSTGLIIIAMMSHVQLGYSSQLALVKPQILAAFIMIFTASILLFTLSKLGYQLIACVFSAGLWCLSFITFFLTFWPVQSKPRH